MRMGVADLLNDEGPDLGAVRLQAEMAERRRTGVAAANQFLYAYSASLRGEDKRGELVGFEYVAVHICGIGAPFSAVGERDLSVEERVREFLDLPELTTARERPWAVEFLRDQDQGVVSDGA